MSQEDEFYIWPNQRPGRWAPLHLLAFGRKNGYRATSGTDGDHHSLNYVLRGSYRLEFGGIDQSLDIGADSLFFLPPGTRYSYVADSTDSPADPLLLWIRLTGPTAREYVEALGFSMEHPVISVDSPDRVLAITASIERLYHDYSPASDALAIARLYELIPACTEGYRAPSEDLSLEERVWNFIHGELDSGYNVDQIAKIFGISRHSLFNRMKRRYGLGPLGILQAARTSRAKSLLLTTQATVAKVATMSGHANASHFIHHFKRETGMTPTEFRRANSRNVQH